MLAPHAVSCMYATFFPSRRLQRLGPVWAARSECWSHRGVLRLCCAPSFPIELPLLWFSKERPSAVSSDCVLSRVSSREMNRFGPSLPRDGLLPPLPFLPALTVYSAFRPASLLHLASGPGVRAVLLSASHLNVSPHCVLLRSLLALAFIPFEAFPLPIAAPRLRVAFPSRRFTSVPFPVPKSATSGRYSIAKSVAVRAVSRTVGPMLPWALFLFKVLPSPRVLQ